MLEESDFLPGQVTWVCAVMKVMSLKSHIRETPFEYEKCSGPGGCSECERLFEVLSLG